MSAAPARRLALLVASLLIGPALVGTGCVVVLDLPDYTPRGPSGADGCGDRGGDDGAPAPTRRMHMRTADGHLQSIRLVTPSGRSCYQ